MSEFRVMAGNKQVTVRFRVVVLQEGLFFWLLTLGPRDGAKANTEQLALQNVAMSTVINKTSPGNNISSRH